MVDTVLGQQLCALLDRGQHARCVVGPQHGHRVRVEGDRHDGAAGDLVGDLTGTTYDVLVAQVDPVEVADGHHGATEVVGHLGQ